MKILSPAGSYAAGIAAIESGADAIYLGLRNIHHQRSRCTNFSKKELTKITRIAREKNVEINVTFNSSYNQKNFDSIVKQLTFLNYIGVSAVIISDIGLIPIIKEKASNLKIRFSVQGQCSNSSFASILKEQGVDTVILDRNMSIEEAASIKKKVNIGVELFAFGYQCYSQDSLCYMGDYFYGEPCNVQCSQQIRFLDTGEQKRFFFMKYQSALPFIPDLIKSNIDYIKIEGRQRSAAYVQDATRVFREAVDSFNIDPQKFTVKKEWEQTLERLAYGFEVTHAFYVPHAYQRTIIAQPRLKNILLYGQDIFRYYKETGNFTKLRKEIVAAIKVGLRQSSTTKEHEFEELN
jgi:putative protease